jgi:hypothetical protein
MICTEFQKTVSSREDSGHDGISTLLRTTSLSELAEASSKSKISAELSQNERSGLQKRLRLVTTPPTGEEDSNLKFGIVRTSMDVHLLYWRRTDHSMKYLVLRNGPVHLAIHRQRPKLPVLQQWFLCTVVAVPWFLRSRPFRSPPILLFVLLFANF